MIPELRGPNGTRQPSGLIGRIVATVVAAATLVIGLMFSVVVFAIALAVGLAVFGWLWWKMRKVMKQARQAPHLRPYHEGTTEATQPGSNQIIEGEVISGEWKKERDPP